MLAEGYATIDKDVKDEDIPDDVRAWAEFQEEANEKQAGLWKFGTAVAEQEDSDYWYDRPFRLNFNMEFIQDTLYF